MAVALGVSAALPWPGHVAAQSADEGLPGWLAGCWVARSAGLRIDEVWMEPAGGVMVGMSRTVREGRPPAWEWVFLGPRDGVLTFSAHPSGQALTHFRAARATPDTLRFENPDHDFPRAIEYRRTAPDSLLALVFGEVDAADPSFVVPYGREPCPGG